MGWCQCLSLPSSGGHQGSDWGEGEAEAGGEGEEVEGGGGGGEEAEGGARRAAETAGGGGQQEQAEGGGLIVCCSVSTGAVSALQLATLQVEVRKPRAAGVVL